MTAEIAILNRSSVALAADSAGTIGQGGGAKIYNAFNKIFELSEIHPVGVMIYGSLDFMGMPLESVIKQYRKQLGTQSFDHVNDYMTDFLRYLQEGVPWSEANERLQATSILLNYFQKLASRVDEAITKEFRTKGRWLKGQDNAMIRTILASETRAQDGAAMVNGFTRATARATKIKWAAELKATAETRFGRYKLTKANLDRLSSLGANALVRAPLSDGRTGIVVAGFGANEWCPSLAAIETDGIVMGKLKYVQSKEPVDIGRDGPHASMLGFAQDDMVSTFLNGVDPRYETYVGESMSTLFGELVSAFTMNGGITQDQAATMRAFFNGVRDSLNTRLSEFRNNSFQRPILDMIRFMPAQELATLAASMIEITSLKRRVTRDRETVGGDVDVAVITKAEGFVWIKRKHYFPADLNPRFFKRLSRSAIGGEL